VTVTIDRVPRPDEAGRADPPATTADTTALDRDDRVEAEVAAEPSAFDDEAFEQPGPTEPTDGRPPRRRLWILAVLGAALVALLVAAVVADRRSGDAVKPVLPLDAWAPYWALDESAPEIGARAGSLRQVSPFWFTATGVSTIVEDPNAKDEPTGEFLKRARGVEVVPSIVDATDPGVMAGILTDPTTRAQHVKAIVDFAEKGGYDGVDIDYERFAFSDGRDTWPSTRPAWVAFITELGAALHADGRILTVSVPPVYDAGQTDASGYWVYDYGAIAPHVDAIRIMAYDYSVPAPGPIAPVAFVQQAIDGAIAATGAPKKLVLGVPAYGRNWAVATEGTCPTGVDVPGTTSVTARGVDDLVAKRGATPVYDAVAGEWSFEYPFEISDGTTTCVQTRRVHYVDAAGVRQRIDLARQAGLGGTALWALGFEDDAVWDAILATDAPTTTSGR